MTVQGRAIPRDRCEYVRALEFQMWHSRRDEVFPGTHPFATKQMRSLIKCLGCHRQSVGLKSVIGASINVSLTRLNVARAVTQQKPRRLRNVQAQAPKYRPESIPAGRKLGPCFDRGVLRLEPQCLQFDFVFCRTKNLAIALSNQFFTLLILTWRVELLFQRLHSFHLHFKQAKQSYR